MKSLVGKRICLTGGTSGLGLVVANHIISQGGELFLLLRDESKLKDIKVNDQVHPIICDLSNTKDIENAINKIKSITDELDVLINNAGLWVFGEKKLTEEGTELTWQVNVVAPFLLIEGLKELLINGNDAIIINTASALHQGYINWDDPCFEKTSFSGFLAYRQSKLAILLLTLHYATELENSIKVVSNHPGVVSTNLAQSANWFIKWFFSLLGKSPKKGAQTIIHLLENSDKAISSAYYINKKVAKTSTPESRSSNSANRLVKLLKSNFGKSYTEININININIS